MNWQAINDQYDRAGWLGRRKIELSLVLYALFILTMLALAALIEKVRGMVTFIKHGAR